MKKSDLKTGMLVQTRNGDIYLMINDMLVNSMGRSVLNVNGTTESHNKNLEDNNFDSLDIMSVSNVLTGKSLSIDNWNESTLNGKLLWKREEPKPILTLDGVEYSKETLRSLIKKATS